jgi:hypothetical protein
VGACDNAPTVREEEEQVSERTAAIITYTIFGTAIVIATAVVGYSVLSTAIFWGISG